MVKVFFLRKKKLILTYLQGEIDKPIITVGDFNMFFSVTDRSKRKKTAKI